MRPCGEVGSLGADLNGAAEDRKSQPHSKECMHSELGFGRKGGECGLSRKGSFGEGVKCSENLVWNFVREEEGGKLSMIIWVGASYEIRWVGMR